MEFLPINLYPKFQILHISQIENLRNLSSIPRSDLTLQFWMTCIIDILHSLSYKINLTLFLLF